MSTVVFVPSQALIFDLDQGCHVRYLYLKIFIIIDQQFDRLIKALDLLKLY